jgi:hypothetical protein
VLQPKDVKPALSVDIYLISQLVKDKEWYIFSTSPYVKIFNNFQSLLFESDLNGADIEVSVSVLSVVCCRWRNPNSLVECADVRYG